MPKRTPSSAADLLYTKLAPPRTASGTPAGLISRPALIDRLEAGLARKVTLLSAPAGSGKTTLISEWLARQAQPVAWVALDDGDNDPVRFWRYVITACRTFDAALGRAALAALRTASLSSLESVLTPFINELLQLPERHVLILEDAHLITSSEVNASLAFLIDQLPATVHLILLTRSEPALPLARLRARNELSEFTAADLRFTLVETQVFLREALHVELTPEAIARLEERTEGWIAGLQLIALALHGRSEPQAVEEFLATFSGGHRYVLEYLVSEVLGTQPAAWQEFLLQTSWVNRLTAALCDAITDRTDSALLLTQLERANLFLIPLGNDGHHTWYRYHALFAEALRHTARQRLGDSGVRAVLEKASRWYEDYGFSVEAIEAALAAPAFERAAVLIEQSIEQRGTAELHTLGCWVTQLPEAVLSTHPILCFHYAFVLLFTSDRYAPATAARLEAPLRRAEAAWRTESNEARLGQVLALRSLAGLWQDNLPLAFAQAREALELLPEHDVFWRGVSLLNVGLEEMRNGRIHAAQQLFIETRALCGAAQNIHGVLAATYLLGEAGAWQGQFDQASQLYQQVLAKAIGGEEMLDDQAAAQRGLAAVAYERNDLDAAEQQATRAHDLSVQRSNEEEQVQASLLLARIQHARGQTAQAQELLQTLTARTQRAQLLFEIQLWQSRLALMSGDLETARHGAAVHDQRRTVPYLQQEQAALLLARLQLIDQNPEAALKLLEPWRRAAQQSGRMRSEIEILCVQALAYADQANPARAHKTLTQALTLAQPTGYRRIFLDEGEKLAQLLQAITPELGKRPIATYATLLLRAFAATRVGQLASFVLSPLLEPLSAQEQRVLRLLAAGLSKPEIARELVVSTNTIKTQVQSIYRKLNVNSRDEAADMARQLNLL
ncbi:HTH-type transcriptional regulator MalT [Thermoflexales bacterium]|nr:HTH-type transcriptional regulator MalT [Thermoflexales bacterium]